MVNFLIVFYFLHINDMEISQYIFCRQSKIQNFQCQNDNQTLKEFTYWITSILTSRMIPKKNVINIRPAKLKNKYCTQPNYS